jgi:predicted NAD-dependent protein-ADP-ribosyltransferase YbiA (DUF1768 family)
LCQLVTASTSFRCSIVLFYFIWGYLKCFINMLWNINLSGRHWQSFKQILGWAKLKKSKQNHILTSVPFSVIQSYKRFFQTIQ